MARHFRHRARCCASSNTWTWAPPTAGAWTRCCRRPRWWSRINAEFPLGRWTPNSSGETAERWRYADGGGEIGVISSVTQAFCGDCNRARLSTEGKLFLCLFASQGHDLRALLRGNGDAATQRNLGGRRSAPIWQARARPLFGTARGPAARACHAPAPARVEMSYIGGCRAQHRPWNWMTIQRCNRHHRRDPGRRPGLAHGRRGQGPAKLSTACRWRCTP